VGVVAYGNIVLCQSCDTMRSAVGRTEVAQRLAGAELMKVAAELSEVEGHVAEAVQGARDAGASWAEVGDALGITRQAAQQRYAKLGSPR
jgi:hypothetical protein